MVGYGFYIVQRCESAAPPLKLKSWQTRPSVVHPPEVVRYQSVSIGKDLLLLNERGDIVLFQHYDPQREPGVTVEHAYRDNVEFDEAYNKALSIISEFSGRAISDTNDTFLAEFRDGEPVVDWASTKLPLQTGECGTWQLLAEALFIHSLCSRTETILHDLTTRMPSKPNLQPLLRCAGDLVQLEAPQQYLVGKREIDLMSQFYDKWGMVQATKKLQERTSQLISSYSVLFDQQQAIRSTVLSRIVAALSVLALLSVSDTISSLFGLTDSTQVDTVLIGTSGGLVGLTLISSIFWPALASLATHTRGFFHRLAIRSRLK